MALNLELTPEQIAELVRETCGGRTEAFARLVETHQRVARGIARQQLPHASDVDDVVQEAFIRAFRRLQTLREPKRFTSWLLHVVINVAREYRRREKLTLVPLELAPEPRAPEVDTTQERSEQQMLAVLGRMAPKYAVPLSLRYLESMSYGEIAERLGISEVGVRSRVHRARRLLAKRIAATAAGGGDGDG